jgi:hypothetical protein
MKRHLKSSFPKLGIFSLGVSLSIYCFLQYLFTPIVWWFAQSIDALGWLNYVFVHFDFMGVEIFTSKSIIYSLLGLSAFTAGYLFLPKKITKIRNGILKRTWACGKAETMFWVLFIGGFALKLLKLLIGVDFSGSVPGYLFNQPHIAFLLSLNWLHFLGISIINIAHLEAKSVGSASVARLRVTSHFANIFVIVVSLASGSVTSTALPIITLLVIRQFYMPIPVVRMILIFSSLGFVILVLKYITKNIIFENPSAFDEDRFILFGLFYMLFFRVNMSHVVNAVIESGQSEFSGGTLGQFWVDLLPYGMDRVNAFDGNVFGRMVGLLPPTDFVTGVAVTNMGDLYINFGLSGIVVGMFLTGILYKILSSSCCGQRGPLFVLIYSLMWPILVHGMESPITVLYANSLKMIVLCLFVHIFVARNRRVCIQNRCTLP